MKLIGGLSSLRVLTCSTDRTVVMYDVHSAKQVNNPKLFSELTIDGLKSAASLCAVPFSN